MPPASSQLHYHFDFPSGNLNNKRTIAVWLPPNYNPDSTYPVLYLHDGQNMFDKRHAAYGAIWEADKTAERLIRQGFLRPLILVGIDNNLQREEEYTLQRDPREKRGGNARNYGKFLTEELKPFIDSHYQTKAGPENCGVAGSSLGGLVSLTLALDYPEVFGLCGAISASLWWANQKSLYDVLAQATRLSDSRIWFDMGTEEGKYPGCINPPFTLTRLLASRLEQIGLLPGWNYYYQEIVGGQHHENDWRDRFDRILLFLFGKPEAASKSIS